VILADEPTGNLDVNTAGEVSRLLLELQREEGFTLIVVTHSLELAGMMNRVVELTTHGIVERKAGERYA
jgi:ABC-type lipoprotein export system ATPase subunit